MRSELTGLHRRLATTMIYVTHDQVEAMTMADKIVVLRAGRVEQVGAPLELYNRPANQFVAGFIGSPRMNFLPGVVEEAGRVAVDRVGPVLAGRGLFRPGDAVVVGIRPEHLELQPGGGGARVTAVEQLGGLSYIRLDLHDVMVQLAGQTRLAPGDAVGLVLPPERLHVFTADGAALV